MPKRIILPVVLFPHSIKRGETDKIPWTLCGRMITSMIPLTPEMPAKPVSRGVESAACHGRGAFRRSYAMRLHQPRRRTFAIVAEEVFYRQVPRELPCITASAALSAGHSARDRYTGLGWQGAFALLRRLSQELRVLPSTWQPRACSSHRFAGERLGMRGCDERLGPWRCADADVPGCLHPGCLPVALQKSRCSGAHCSRGSPAVLAGRRCLDCRIRRFLSQLQAHVRQRRRQEGGAEALPALRRLARGLCGLRSELRGAATALGRLGVRALGTGGAAPGGRGAPDAALHGAGGGGLRTRAPGQPRRGGKLRHQRV